MFKNFITGAVAQSVHGAAALAHRAQRARSPVNYDDFGLDVFALSKAVTKKENFNFIKKLMEDGVDNYNSEPGAEKCSLVDILTYNSNGKTDAKSLRKQEAVSAIRLGIYAYFLDIMRAADEHLTEKTLPGVLAEIVLRSFDLDAKNHSARLNGALEPEVEGLLKAIAAILFEMETDKTIKPQSWENIQVAESASSKTPEEPPSSPQTPRSEKSNDSDSKLQNVLVEYLNKSFQATKYFAQEAVSTVIKKISGRKDGDPLVRAEQCYSPELLAISEFDSQNFAKEHVRDLPKIVSFFRHIFEKPADEKDEEFRKSLFIFIKAMVLGKVAPEGAMAWVDQLLQYLKQEAVTDSPEANKAIQWRNIAREHVIDIIIHQMFPSLKRSENGEDFNTFTAEFKALIQNTHGAGDIINHLSPKAFEILRKPEHQPYLRTLVDTVFTSLYSYTPEQLQVDHRRNLEVSSIDESVEELKKASVLDSPRGGGSSKTASMTSIELSVSTGTLSTTSTKRDWSVHETYGEHFTDDMMHFLLNAQSLTSTTLSELLKDIGSVKIDGIFRRLFAQESRGEQPHLNSQDANQKFGYNEEVFNGLVMQNPAGLLRFVAKILVQALPDPDNEKIPTLAAKNEKLKSDEEMLVTDLWNTFKSPIDSLESNLRLLTQGLADYGAGIEMKDRSRVTQGLDKILTLLPHFNDNLLQADPPNNIVKMIVQNILPMPPNIAPNDIEAFKGLQLRLLREVANNLANTIKNGTLEESAQARTQWAAAISYFITPAGSKDYGVQAQSQRLRPFEKVLSCFSQAGSLFSVFRGTLGHVTSIVHQSYDNLLRNNNPGAQEQCKQDSALLAKYYPAIYYSVATVGGVAVVHGSVANTVTNTVSAVKVGASLVSNLLSGWSQSYQAAEPSPVIQKSLQQTTSVINTGARKPAKRLQEGALKLCQSGGIEKPQAYRR